jgi:hypothetical protein
VSTAAANRAAADALVSEIRDAFRKGSLAVGFSPDNIAAMLAFGPAAVFFDWAKTDAQRRLENALKALGGRITRWETVYRSWAERGQRDDGSPYSWPRWSAYAREDLAREIKDLLATSVNESLFLRFVTEVVIKTGEDVMKPFTPQRWPTWVKVAVVGGAGVVVLAILYPYAAPLLPRRSVS